MPQLETSTYLSQIFWLISSFLALWFFMAWFIIPKIEDIMEQRRSKIDAFLQKAEKINKQALMSLKKYEKALEKAKLEAQNAIEKNKEELEKSVSEKRFEIEELLNNKIADTEVMLAKERKETLAAIDEVSICLASDILTKLDVQNIDIDALKKSAGDNK